MSLKEKIKRILKQIALGLASVICMPLFLVAFSFILLYLIVSVVYNIVIAVLSVFTKKNLPFIDFERSNKEGAENGQNDEDNDKEENKEE